MNKTPDETPENTKNPLRKKHPRHPYMMSNSREVTLERMRSFPERAAKFLEKLNAEREKNAR
jgi:hypothetical protein